MSAVNAGLVLGSSRASGWSRKLGRALAGVTPAGLALREIAIADLPLYHEELEARVPPEWARFRDDVRAVDALVFVTPEYNRSIPAMLKNAVDIGSSPDDCSVWTGKPAGIVSFSPGMLGGFGANHHLRQALVYLDMPVVAQPEIYLSRVDLLFDDDGVLHDGPVRELLASLLERLVALTEATSSRSRRSSCRHSCPTS